MTVERRSARVCKAVKRYAEDNTEEYEQIRPIKRVAGVIEKEEGPAAGEEPVNIDRRLHLKREPSSDTNVEELRPENKTVKPGKMRSVTAQHPPEGTLIPWGTSRTRKQPKLYPVPANPYKYRQDNRGFADAAARRIIKMRERIAKLLPGQNETRLKPFVAEPPDWYLTFLERANTQKMFVLERTRGMEGDCHAHHADCPYEQLEVAGSTGSVYTVVISHLTSCTCPVGVFTKTGQEKQCKHVLYVLHHVLKAPAHLKYQAAFMTAELKELFDSAPLPVDSVEEEAMDGNRKTVEGDCPICFMELDAHADDIVWCKAACGNNLHHDCLQRWAEGKPNVTCPLCRSDWLRNERTTKTTAVQMPTAVGPSGYRNVYSQLDY